MNFLEIPYSDPLRAFAPWAPQPWAMLLDSGGPDRNRARYSYLAVEPFQTLQASGDGDPFAALAEALAAQARRRPPRLASKPAIAVPTMPCCSTPKAASPRPPSPPSWPASTAPG
ncbi:hypothetical protein [Pararhodospirillum photometricum]|uniref:hypothetical protein n=1 Tax=Pararhodospirillum photometricum TaxID=1084 RepID=UPI0012FEBFE5|nr:hypothetical protein [Pararhodospirillum photometricum]